MNKIVVGLGNPGKKYKHTRHNVGFMVLDLLAQKQGLDWKTDKYSESIVSKGTIAGQEVILAKPQNFMNDSGTAVLALLKNYQLPVSSLLVVHDEIDLPFGTLRASHDSSSAGHNGVQSVINFLKTKNFTRLRIGVNSRTDGTVPTEAFVLQNFLPEEWQKLSDTLLAESVNQILTLIQKDSL
jgi:peptidyl-tRNA hydrolase, PTH1 family